MGGSTGTGTGIKEDGDRLGYSPEFGRMPYTPFSRPVSSDKVFKDDSCCLSREGTGRNAYALARASRLVEEFTD